MIKDGQTLEKPQLLEQKANLINEINFMLETKFSNKVDQANSVTEFDIQHLDKASISYCDDAKYIGITETSRPSTQQYVKSLRKGNSRSITSSQTLKRG